MKQTQILSHLNHLPRKMVTLHNHQHLPEFILYDLCHESCFNFSKAAYLVDNPDFDCFKGVTGLNRQEPNFCQGICDVWQESDRYHSYMQQSPFNSQVRQIMLRSIARHNEPSHKILDDVAHDLGFSHPEYFSWLMKHDNHGYLIVEQQEKLDPDLQECLENGVHLLSFCSIA